MEEGPTPLVFPAAASTSVLDAEREAHRRRAERFGTDYVQPEKRSDLRQQFRKERLKKDGFKTGLDLFDEEEVARMRQRAARFQTDFKAPEYKPAEPPEDEQKKAQRAARFGMEYAPPGAGALMEIDVLEERMERPPDIPRRPEAIHLYGVDCMTSAECLAYFGDWGPTFVEWLDDSSCNVLFEDDYTAKRALVGRGRPLPPGSDDGPDTAGLDPSDISSAPFLWHKGDDFVKAGTPIPLMYRMATAADVKPEKGRKLSRHLWKLPPKQAVRQQKAEVRRKQGGAADGYAAAEGEDVHMRQSRGQRTRKRRRGAGDVEMADAEEVTEDVEEDGGAEAQRPAVADLRELLGRQPEQQAGLFSASAAGFALVTQEEQVDELAGDAHAAAGDAGDASDVEAGNAGQDASL